MTRNLKEFVNHRVRIGGNFDPINFAPDHIMILIALYNGAETLGDQLDSISKQAHQNWSLIVSDDGSEDDWPAAMEGFLQRHAKQTWCVEGPRCGSTLNFLQLICQAGPLVPFVALCDQDDRWLPPKLHRAMFMLQDIPPETPALYVAPTYVCDHQLNPLRRSKRFRRPPSFANALVQSIGGGNTMVLNRAALDLVQETARHARDVKAHDWWIYQIVAGAGGVIRYDQMPLVLYRQHARNQVGANDSLAASLSRVHQVFKGRFREWNANNAKALEAANHWLTPDARQTLTEFNVVRTGPFKKRLGAFWRAGFYRQTWGGHIFLYLAVLFKKL